MSKFPLMCKRLLVLFFYFWLCFSCMRRHIQKKKKKKRLLRPMSKNVLCFLLEILWFQVPHLSLYSILILFFYMLWESSPVWFFACNCPSFPTPLIEEALFPPIGCSCFVCNELIAHISMGSFLGSLFCFIVLFVYLGANTYYFNYCRFVI